MKPKTNPKELQYLKWSVKFFKFGYYILTVPTLAYWALKLARPLYVEKETFLNRLVRWSFLVIGGGTLPPEDLGAFRYGLKALR